MKIISGDEFGIIKYISTKKKQIIDQYGSLDSSKSIINIFCNKDINIEEDENNSDNFMLYHLIKKINF